MEVLFGFFLKKGFEINTHAVLCSCPLMNPSQVSAPATWDNAAANRHAVFRDLSHSPVKSQGSNHYPGSFFISLSNFSQWLIELTQYIAASSSPVRAQVRHTVYIPVVEPWWVDDVRECLGFSFIRRCVLVNALSIWNVSSFFSTACYVHAITNMHMINLFYWTEKQNKTWFSLKELLSMKLLWVASVVLGFCFCFCPFHFHFTPKFQQNEMLALNISEHQD